MTSLSNDPCMKICPLSFSPSNHTITMADKKATSTYDARLSNQIYEQLYDYICRQPNQLCLADALYEKDFRHETDNRGNIFINNHTNQDYEILLPAEITPFMCRTKLQAIGSHWLGRQTEVSTQILKSYSQKTLNHKSPTILRTICQSNVFSHVPWDIKHPDWSMTAGTTPLRRSITSLRQRKSATKEMERYIILRFCSQTLSLGEYTEFHHQRLSQTLEL